MIPTIQIVNQSSVPLPLDKLDLMTALVEYERILASVWNVQAVVAWTEPGESVPPWPCVWPLVLADTTDQAGALGYHTVQGQRPAGFVFLKSVQEAGLSDLLEVILHEFAEMLTDPWCMETFLGPMGTYLAKEICDPLEGCRFQSQSGFALPNFVYPAWFGLANRDGSQKLDHMGVFARPYQLLPAGYIETWTSGMGWSTAVGGDKGDRIAAFKRKHGKSRSMIRRWNIK